MVIDLFGNPNRPTAELATGRWIFSFAILILFAIFFAREFLSLDLRTKIVLAILATGGMALGILSFFAINQTQRITGSLSERLESSVQTLSEEQLVNTVSAQADLANQSFEDVVEEIVKLSHQLGCS